jgi:hypothetical protein
MTTVKSIDFNWHQAGNLHSDIGDNYSRYTVGISGVISIVENEPCNGMQLWNYVILLDDGRSYRVFNPNFVEYYPPVE